MQPTRLLCILGIGLAASHPVLAQDAVSWIGAPDCRLAAVKPAPVAPPTWSGGCKDGFADGKGVLEWRSKKGDAFRLTATFAAGQVQGEAELHYQNGIEYTGTVKDGIPEGHGYLRYPDGAQYEGEMRHGHSEGMGEQLYASGNDYKGQWKNDERDGTGTMTYVLGGRYEGGWKNDEWSGPGKLFYAGPPGREVATVDGRDPNRPDAPAPDKKYVVKEDLARTGSLFKLDVARNLPVPADRGYEQLSPEQQATVNSWWPALAPGDEPPYPLHGTAEFHKLMSQLVSRTGVQGTISVYVTVSKEGKATGVRAVGLNDPEIRKFIATAAAVVKYKPARCAGQPCEMAYPYRLNLKLE